MGDLKTALEWTNKIINERVTVETKVFYHFARILNLVIHFELGNLDLLEYLLRSYKRFLAKANKYYLLEKAFIVFLDAMLTAQGKETELIKRLKLFRDKISNMQDPLEYNIYEYFDFRSWIQSKLEKRSYADILTLNRSKN